LSGDINAASALFLAAAGHCEARRAEDILMSLRSGDLRDGLRQCGSGWRRSLNVGLEGPTPHNKSCDPTKRLGLIRLGRGDRVRPSEEATMDTANLARLCYWGGWASAVTAVLYKALFSFGVIMYPILQVLPRHLWQLAFLFFLIAVASASVGRAKA